MPPLPSSCCRSIRHPPSGPRVCSMFCNAGRDRQVPDKAARQQACPADVRPVEPPASPHRSCDLHLADVHVSRQAQNGARDSHPFPAGATRSNAIGLRPLAKRRIAGRQNWRVRHMSRDHRRQPTVRGAATRRTTNTIRTSGAQDSASNDRQGHASRHLMGVHRFLPHALPRPLGAIAPGGRLPSPS